MEMSRYFCGKSASLYHEDHFVGKFRTSEQIRTGAASVTHVFLSFSRFVRLFFFIDSLCSQPRTDANNSQQRFRSC